MYLPSRHFKATILQISSVDSVKHLISILNDPSLMEAGKNVSIDQSISQSS